MNYLNMSSFGVAGLGQSSLGLLIILVVLWSLVWKGLALWRSARRGDKWWFIAFLIVNTLGILEIIYLFAITGAKLSDFTGRNTSGSANPSV